MSQLEPPTQTLLPNRAFVVQFSTDAEIESGRAAGRAEHVISRQVCQFKSLEELLAFISRVLHELPE